jgi:hypothetical protein
MKRQGLFEFWAEAAKTNFMFHPADKPVLDKYAKYYSFPLDTLVGPLMGPAENAPITLLYANGGRSDEDFDPDYIETSLPSYGHHLSGQAALPFFENHPPARRWTEARIKPFGLSYARARDKVAFLNIVPYKSKNMDDWRKPVVRDLIEELPSVQMMRQWVHQVLISDAIAERRMVVCLRAAWLWKLEAESERKGGLFTPRWNRRGIVPTADRLMIWKFMGERLGIHIDEPTKRAMRSVNVQVSYERGSLRADHADNGPLRDSSRAKGNHIPAWREYREGRLDGENARRLMDATITGVFPERQRVRAHWRKELFALYRAGQSVSHFVRAGMNHAFQDPKGDAQVMTERQMLDHVCWDVSGSFIAIDPKFP